MRKEVKINDKIYYVGKPTAKDEYNAKLQQTKTFSKALSEGACLKVELNKALAAKKIWTDEDSEELKQLNEKVEENISKLEEGGIELMEARKLAIETNRLRMRALDKLDVLRQQNSLTAEGMADDAYFDSLVSSCCFDEEGKKVFSSYDDYLNKSTEDYAVQLARELSRLLYGDTDFLKELPENKFLLEFKFVDDDLSYIDENGNPVNSDYEPIVEKEKPVRKPFLKDGQPISE